MAAALSSNNPIFHSALLERNCSAQFDIRKSVASKSITARTAQSPPCPALTGGQKIFPILGGHVIVIGQLLINQLPQVREERRVRVVKVVIVEETASTRTLILMIATADAEPATTWTAQHLLSKTWKSDQAEVEHLANRDLIHQVEIKGQNPGNGRSGTAPILQPVSRNTHQRSRE